MPKRKRLLALIGTVVLLVSLSVPLMQCAPAAEKAAYDKYVAGLPAGSLPVPQDCFEQAMEEGEVCLYEWEGWWPDEVYENFSEEFGIKVTRDGFGGSSEVRAKFLLYPETDYDLIICIGPSSFDFLQEAGALQQINHDWTPNVWEYVPEGSLDVGYDPGWKSSVGFEMWFTAPVLNTELVDDPRLPSWSVMLEPMDEVKGKIAMWNDQDAVIGAALKYLGYNWNSDNEAELMEAKELVLELKPDIMVFDSAPKTLLLTDEVWISGQWYNDGWSLHEDYEAIEPWFPAEGTEQGIDLLMNPIGSSNPAAAHLWINYIFRPEVNALICETLRLSPFHTASVELFSEEVRGKVAVPEGYLAKCDSYEPRRVTGRGLELRTAIWEELRS